ncbi:hypothetical protein GJ496_004054 [Pomphorhynchus laevis]|nr:hypothetical protein GJ496_004054 [Pomphorhynchus laevis]
MSYTRDILKHAKYPQDDPPFVFLTSNMELCSERLLQHFQKFVSENYQLKMNAGIPTIEEIFSDPISELAGKYWLKNKFTDEERPSFNADLVSQIYRNEMLQTNFSTKRLSMLELSQYLELYLWPNYHQYDINFKTREHTVSIAALINEKFRERVDAWTTFQSDNARFEFLFNEVLRLILEDKESLLTKTVLITFLSHSVQSLEFDFVRNQVQRILGIECWHNIPETRRNKELNRSAKLLKYWNYLQKKECDQSDKVGSCEENAASRRFNLLFNRILSKRSRFFVGCTFAASYPKQSAVFHASAVFQKSHKMLCEIIETEIDDCSGESINHTERHYQRMAQLQRTVFKLVKRKKLNNIDSNEETDNLIDKLTVFAASSIASVDQRKFLFEIFSQLTNEDLIFICEDLSIDIDRCKGVLVEVILYKHERKTAPLEMLNALPLFQTEKVIWDQDLVPELSKGFGGKLALPKLNLQFLTLLDYLQRNFVLFRLESTYEIRQDLESAISRLKPARSEVGQCIFSGWSRMALPLQSFTIVDVKSPLMGEKCPSVVKADFEVSLDIRNDIRQEWEALRKHDVCFLICVKGLSEVDNTNATSFMDKHGIKYIRGCEIEGMLDAHGKVIDDGNPNEEPVMPAGSKRTFRVWLDSNQYYEDESIDEIYESFNIIVRRKPKENNFKAVLETIRSLMNTKFVVPEWLNDLILGYGDPSAACYTKLCPNEVLKERNWHDTFVSKEHLENSFPDYTISFQPPNMMPHPPFRLRIDDNKRTVVATSYSPPIPGPLSIPCTYRGNTVPFTVAQVKAIRSGMLPGLTMIVGPPGTGKTDIAVQIIANIYRNHPEQRTLVVAHSNHALNQLFEKIINLNVDQRHLLRLGHGEQALSTELDFSRYGRVNYILEHRIKLLSMVDKLAKCLHIAGDVGYTCETANHFFLQHVVSKWEEFLEKCHDSSLSIEDLFPFTNFFDDENNIFKQEQLRRDGWTREDQIEFARSCFRDIQHIFRQLDEFTAFEQMRTGAERAKYLLVKEAKIVAMTCTHAALKRKDLVECGFKYDNIIMEESAQILEIETFIPILLQNPDIGHLRFKRWIMIGDHHQLAPVVKHIAFQKYSNMEQSLFTRLIRLGVPAIQLDAQGRSRRSIASLYQWRYDSLGNLPHIADLDRYANPGFLYDHQLIDCENINGVGESEPVPYFFQNLSEAEYVVALYMFMRLMGYPREKITIITTYNGQKHLIREIVRRRCSRESLIGWPHKITTVDKYQGQQNDFILLSLVRTKTVGHLRDVRRLIVAMSRARLGLYVFARVRVFQNCVELNPVFSQLLKRPIKLHIIPNDKTNSDVGEPRLYNHPPNSNVFVPSTLKELVLLVHEMHQNQKATIAINEQYVNDEKISTFDLVKDNCIVKDVEPYDPLFPEFSKKPRLDLDDTVDVADQQDQVISITNQVITFLINNVCLNFNS